MLKRGSVLNNLMNIRAINRNSLKGIVLLSKIGQDIISSLQTELIIQKVYKNLNRFIDASILAIGIYNKLTGNLDFWGTNCNTKTIKIGTTSLNDSNAWSVNCFLNQKIIFRNKPSINEGMYFTKILFSEADNCRRSFIYIPLTLKKNKIGVLTVQSYKENAYSSYQLKLLQNLALYITIALENANAFQKIEHQKEEIIQKNQLLENHQKQLEQRVEERTKEIVKQKEEILLQSKKLEMLSIVAEQTENAIMIMDPVGNVLWVNQGFTRIYNYKYEDFIRARGKNILQTSFNPNIRETLDKCIKTKKAVFYEAANVTHDGKEIWTQTSLTPILSEKGEIAYLATIDSDITERMLSQKKIVRQSKAITDSINYAKKIQNTLLPPFSRFKKYLSAYILFYQPKDIVSGDFYWIKKLPDNRIILAAADCTGHGVPGAFMSMLGISLLQQIISSRAIVNAAQVLDDLRFLVKSSLHQKEYRPRELTDGMDIALCIIDRENKKLDYSGAYSPIIIIRNGEIIEIKGDKMPIGLFIKKEECFTNHEIKIIDNDIIYIFSDGFHSQLGGEGNMKFSKKAFLRLLIDASKLNFNKQYEFLLKALVNWRGENGKQTDDILVFGFKPL